MIALVALLVFVAVVVLILALANLTERRHLAATLVQRLAQPSAPLPAARERGARRRARSGGIERLLGGSNLFSRLQEMMWQAGMYARPGDLLLLMAAMSGALFTLVYLVWGDPLVAAGAGASGGLLPLLYVRWRQKRRIASFAAQLPELLDMLKSSLQAGHSLNRGLQAIADEFPDPARAEVRMLLEQTRLGMSVARAFEEMLHRMPEENLRFLVVAIKIQAEVGSSLAEIIGRLSETIRSRQRIKLQIKALTAQPRLSGMVVGLLPAFVLAFFSLIRPEYVSVLFHDPIGKMLLKGAVGADLLALVIIRQMLRVDF
ncbi:MAG TPA: type II secretion system F family protein [Candidatus Binataceae bacterium]|nr:type II secretion system F family protein [Candidatus Binataceae bacterium]